MTRKHYIQFAALIANERRKLDNDPSPYNGGRADAAISLARDLAIIIAADNPNFDRERFIAACQS